MPSDAITLPASFAERLLTVLERLEQSFAANGRAAARASDALLTLGDVAARLRKSTREVQRLMKNGKLKKVPNLGARTTRFRPADVERFLADKENQPGARRL